jgi:hypothetical protein
MVAEKLMSLPGAKESARFTWDRCAAEHQRVYADLKWR